MNITLTGKAQNLADLFRSTLETVLPNPNDPDTTSTSGHHSEILRASSVTVTQGGTPSGVLNVYGPGGAEVRTISANAAASLTITAEDLTAIHTSLRSQLGGIDLSMIQVKGPVGDTITVTVVQ